MNCPVHGPECETPPGETLGEHLTLHRKLREEQEIEHIADIIADHGGSVDPWGAAEEIRDYLNEQWPWR